MRLQEIGVGVFGAVAIVSVVLAVSTIWLFLTDPVTVASAVSEGEVTPFFGISLQSFSWRYRHC
jgi:hypothetical protein